jgi:hypothetical protein
MAPITAGEARAIFGNIVMVCPFMAGDGEPPGLIHGLVRGV